ncbi:hypothetical protein [Actinobacillus vicugnae]|uniref:hypothetical protein n=1 Tax=Actinobacillus vicugnae TaxID=2573093 RepID=UPI0012425D6B|nr:hypothetical protein [Actinobacillus vicugnae]
MDTRQSRAPAWDYNYFGRELGLEPVYPEFYILGGVGAKGVVKGINTITSASTKVTVGVNGDASATSQYLIDGEVNPKQVLWDMAEARITKDFGYKKFVAWNVGTGFIEGYSEKQNVGDGLASAISKLSIASIGYGTGKKVEGTFNSYLNPYKNGFNTAPAGLNGAITKYKPDSVIPTGIGNLSENIFSKPLDYMKGNYDNLKKDEER